MARRSLLAASAAAVLLLAGCSTSGSPPPGSPSVGPTPSKTPSPSVAPTDEAPPSATTEASFGPSNDRAATDLVATSTCDPADPRLEVVELRWSPAATVGSAQRVDVTIFSETFDDDRFTSSRNLPSDAAALDWTDVSPGAVHFWRVVTLQPVGWVASETAQFTGAACIGDDASSP